MTLNLTFHGAARTVTGSCYVLDTGHHRLMVDCGMFQGSKTESALNYRAFPFVPERIDALLLTHAHIDHSGLIPKLVKHGFRGQNPCDRGDRRSLLDHAARLGPHPGDGGAPAQRAQPAPRAAPRRADLRHGGRQRFPETAERRPLRRLVRACPRHARPLLECGPSFGLGVDRDRSFRQWFGNPAHAVLGRCRTPLQAPRA